MTVVSMGLTNDIKAGVLKPLYRSPMIKALTRV